MIEKKQDRPQTKEEVRLWIAAQLDRVELPAQVWQFPDVHDAADEYLNTGDREDLYDCLANAEKALEIFEVYVPHFSHRSRTSVQRQGLPHLRLTPYEEDRTHAYSAYLARRAGERVDVKKYRHTILKGTLLTRTEAVAFVESPALRCLSRWECELGNIPLVGHTAEVVGEEAKIMPNGKLRRSVRLLVDGITRRANLFVERRERPPIVQYDTGVEDDEKIYVQNHIVWKGSVVDELRRLSDRLVLEYGWEQMTAIRFILTGTPPLIQPIEGSVRQWKRVLGRGEITLTLQPWLSEESIVQAYREGQRRLLGDRKKPWVSPRNLRIFRFVEERTDSTTGRRPKWRVLMQEWNNTCDPEDHVKEYRHFAEYYKRAERHLLQEQSQ